MYYIYLYGISGSPPTVAHQHVLISLLKRCPAEDYQLFFDKEHYQVILPGNAFREQRNIQGSLESLGLSNELPDLERSIKIALAQRDITHYYEILCMPNVILTEDKMLDKASSALIDDRLAMVQLMVADINDARVRMCELEIVLSELTHNSSYTANTLKVLRQGALSLKKEHMLNAEQKKLLESTDSALRPQQAALRAKARKKHAQYCQKLNQYLETNRNKCNAFLSKHNKDTIHLNLAMGCDGFNSLGRWYDANDILHDIDEIIVFTREGCDLTKVNFSAKEEIERKKEIEPFYQQLRHSKTLIHKQETHPAYQAISSTTVRKKIEQGQYAEIHELIPSILNYITEKKLYTTS